MQTAEFFNVAPLRSVSRTNILFTVMHIYQRNLPQGGRQPAGLKEGTADMERHEFDVSKPCKERRGLMAVE